MKDKFDFTKMKLFSLKDMEKARYKMGVNIFKNIYPTKDFYSEYVNNSHNSVLQRQKTIEIGQLSKQDTTEKNILK